MFDYGLIESQTSIPREQYRSGAITEDVIPYCPELTLPVQTIIRSDDMMGSIRYYHNYPVLTTHSPFLTDY